MTLLRRAGNYFKSKLLKHIRMLQNSSQTQNHKYIYLCPNAKKSIARFLKENILLLNRL